MTLLAALGGPQLWERRNYAGRTVTLLGGLATAGALSLSTGLAAAALAGRDPRAARVCAAGSLAVTAAGASGLWDDLGERLQRTEDDAPPAKGLRGHLGALAQGRLTTGATKILGIGAGALAAALILPAPSGRAGGVRRAAEVVTSSVVIAGTANLLNLLDLRPGRALKATVLISAPLLVGPGAPCAAAAVLTSAAAAPADLAERTMLGDTGANALGAAAGVALAAGTALPARLGAAAALVGLTLASEKVSFSKVIAATPVLRELDAAGRRR